MVLIKNWQLFILGEIGQENVFHDSLEKKNALVDDNNKNLRKSKNWDFSKGVSPSFWSKSVYFFAVSFEPKQARKIFFTIF